MCLKAQNHNNVHWMMKDKTDLESCSKNSSSKSSKVSSSSNNNSNKSSNSSNSSTNSGNSKSGNNNNNKKSGSGKSDKSKKSNQPLLNDKLGKDGKLTSKEHERRFKEGLCLYCGQAGHKSPDCRKAKAAKARAVTTESSETLSSGSLDSKKSRATLQKPQHGMRVALTKTMQER